MCSTGFQAKKQRSAPTPSARSQIYAANTRRWARLTFRPAAFTEKEPGAVRFWPLVSAVALGDGQAARPGEGSEWFRRLSHASASEMRDGVHTLRVPSLAAAGGAGSGRTGVMRSPVPTETGARRAEGRQTAQQTRHAGELVRPSGNGPAADGQPRLPLACCVRRLGGRRVLMFPLAAREAVAGIVFRARAKRRRGRPAAAGPGNLRRDQIGRASCRERV